ncbi:MAG: hypothetical protein GX769_00215 [Erysipelothrix sp.]|nr:hypothetical protein [Erysipelothrix sp.]
MKDSKERKIRIENIPDTKLVYQIINSFEYTFFTMFLFGLSFVLLNVEIYLIVIILIIIYLFLSGRYKVEFEVREDFLLYFVDDEFVILIYFDEIVNYQVVLKNRNNVELKILCEDESEYNFLLSDKKVEEYLKMVIGDKNVG